MPFLVGTSGWQYRDWRGRFYPPRLPQRDWLEYYAERFGTVEVNNAFYRLPERSVFEGWRNRTPPDFVVTVKASRYLSHIRRLRDPAEPVTRLMERVAGLGPKAGPILLQLPPNLPVDLDRLEDCLSSFPPGTRVAVEPRHASWWIAEVENALARHDAALCWADRHSAAITPTWRTASFGYLRLHEGARSAWPWYGDDELAGWAGRLAETWPKDADMFVYFNNDPGGAAVGNAVTFTQAAAALGRTVRRAPASAADWPS